MRIAKHDKSYIVELSDSSGWRIRPADMPGTLQWLPTTEIDVREKLRMRSARKCG
jgi:hypothetical protein